MDKVFDYAIKYLGARITSHKGWARMAIEGSKPNLHNLAKVAELEEELKRVKELQKAASK